MFGNEDSPQEVLLKNHVEFGGDASELWEFRWANGELVFTPAERAHANARRQANLKSKRRGTNWRVPEFTQELFAQFEANDVMLSLFQNSKAKKSNPVRPKMSARTRNRAVDGEDDASVDYSYTNDGAEKSTSTPSVSFAKKNKKERGGSVEGLTDALAKSDLLGKKEKNEFLRIMYDYIANGNVEGLQKLVLESGQVFITTASYIQLVISASQPLIPYMGVTESSRQSDNDTEARRSLVFKIRILHPNDRKHVSMHVACV